jgi:hypothetical protein
MPHDPPHDPPPCTQQPTQPHTPFLGVPLAWGGSPMGVPPLGTQILLPASDPTAPRPGDEQGHAGDTAGRVTPRSLAPWQPLPRGEGGLETRNKEWAGTLGSHAKRPPQRPPPSEGSYNFPQGRRSCSPAASVHATAATGGWQMTVVNDSRLKIHSFPFFLPETRALAASEASEGQGG